MFVQGVGVHGEGWRPQVEGLSENYTCLSFDNRGMAGSQPLGSGKLTVQLMAEDALALAASQGWEQFHVVGHSMGGHIATALALAQPHRVSSLVLMCTSARGKDMPPISASFLWTSVKSRLGTKRGRRHAFLEMVLPSEMREAANLDDWSERLEKIFGHDLAETPPIVIKQVRAYRSHDVMSRLGELRNIPTLVISGRHDPIAPPKLGRALAEGIPGARYREIVDASHGVTVTHAAEVNALLSEHVG